MFPITNLAINKLFIPFNLTTYHFAVRCDSLQYRYSHLTLTMLIQFHKIAKFIISNCTEIFVYKPSEQFFPIGNHYKYINQLFPLYLNTCVMGILSIFCNYLRAGIDFKRQILTSNIDFRAKRFKAPNVTSMSLACKGLACLYMYINSIITYCVVMLNTMHCMLGKSWRPLTQISNYLRASLL